MSGDKLKIEVGILAHEHETGCEFEYEELKVLADIECRSGSDDRTALGINFVGLGTLAFELRLQPELKDGRISVWM